MFGLAHVAVVLCAALPCLHTKMGDTANTYSLYRLFSQSGHILNAGQFIVCALFVLCIGAGASFTFRPRDPFKARRLALIVTIVGLATFLLQTLAIFRGYTQSTLPFLPPVHHRAGVGLWLMLSAQLFALFLAAKLPRAGTPSAR